MVFDPTLIPPGAPKLRLAATAARETFRFFWREVFWEQRRIVPGLDLAAVKMPFADTPEALPEGEGVEHMWVNEVTYDGVNVHGTLLNQPQWLQSVRQGDAVSMPLSLLDDWMYAIAGQVYGGFSIQALRVDMEESERTAHDQAWGFDFGPLGETRVLPSGDLQAEHPMSENMVPSFRTGLAEQAEALHAVDDHGWTMLHRHALAGNASIVRLLLELGANANQQTSDGRTAKHLAVMAGWSRTVECFA